MQQTSSSQARCALRQNFIKRFVLLMCIATMAAAMAQAQTIYNSIPKKLPGNVSSVGFEATSASEFGDGIAFKAGDRGTLESVKVILSSWGCQTGNWFSGNCVTTPGATFGHLITLNIYRVSSQPLVAGAIPGTLLASITQQFQIPYRPSADPNHCTGSNAGKWYSSDDKTCYSGVAARIVFDPGNQHIQLPDKAIFGVAFNTTHYGYHPLGATACSVTPAGCPYDSLNVSAEGKGGLTGKVLDPNGVFWNTSYAPFYCTPLPPGRFQLDTTTDPNCAWTNFHPQVQFTVDHGNNDQDSSDKGGDNDSSDTADKSDNGRGDNRHSRK